MNQEANRMVVATRMIENLKRCEDLMNYLVIDAFSLLAKKDAELLKANVGELLGYLYLDVYRRNIIREFPVLKGSLESGMEGRTACGPAESPEPGQEEGPRKGRRAD